MKIVKVTIQKNRTLTETGFKYPEEWDATKINVVAYEENDQLGEINEYCVGIIHDDTYAEELLASPFVEEIDEATASELGNDCKPQTIIVDDNKLGDILVAMMKPRGKRTQEEEEMLDPDSNIRGIRRTPKFDVRQWSPE